MGPSCVTSRAECTYDLCAVYLFHGIPDPVRLPGLMKNTKRKEKTMRKRLTLVGLAALFAAAVFSAAIFSQAAAKPGASGYHVIKTVPVPGDEGWDYVYVDSDARRVDRKS